MAAGRRPAGQAEQMAVVRPQALCRTWEREGRLHASKGRDVHGVGRDPRLRAACVWCLVPAAQHRRLLLGPLGADAWNTPLLILGWEVRVGHEIRP